MEDMQETASQADLPQIDPRADAPEIAPQTDLQLPQNTAPPVDEPPDPQQGTTDAERQSLEPQDAAPGRHGAARLLTVRGMVLGVSLFVALSFLFFLALAYAFPRDREHAKPGDAPPTDKHPDAPPTDRPDDVSPDWTFVEQEQDPAKFRNLSRTIRLPSRMVAYFETLPRAFDRRKIELSTRVNRVLRALAVLTMLGCTGLAAYSGVTQSVLLDLHTLEQIEYYCAIVAGVSMTAFLLSAVLALVALPGQPAVQIVCSALALAAIVCVSGAMVAQLLLRSQTTALPSPTEVSIIGNWMNKFGWGGATAFSSGALGCMAIMFCMEMILFRWKGTWVDPVVTIFALPAAFVYQFGSKNMRFFQRLLRFAFFGRLLLHALNLIIVLPPYLIP